MLQKYVKHYNCRVYINMMKNMNCALIIGLFIFLCIVYAQPIISKARPDLLKTHFIPTLEKLKKKAIKIVMEEEQLRADSKADTQEAELLILDEFAVLCRDLYAFYPILIRYVDNNR